MFWGNYQAIFPFLHFKINDYGLILWVVFLVQSLKKCNSHAAFLTSKEQGDPGSRWRSIFTAEVLSIPNKVWGCHKPILRSIRLLLGHPGEYQGTTHQDVDHIKIPDCVWCDFSTIYGIEETTVKDLLSLKLRRRWRDCASQSVRVRKLWIWPNLAQQKGKESPNPIQIRSMEKKCTGRKSGQILHRLDKRGYLHFISNLRDWLHKTSPK